MRADTSDESTWRYWFELALYPAVFLVAMLLTWTGPGWLLWAAAGAFGWTFVEYWVHRSVLHGFFWHGTHERHHLNPHEYISFPLWYTPLGFAAALAGSLLVGLPVAAWAGFVLGYVWFMSLHHLLHHVELVEGTWLQRYATWHDKHHDGQPVNYGITTNVWDRVFGTYR